VVWKQAHSSKMCLKALAVTKEREVSALDLQGGVRQSSCWVLPSLQESPILLLVALLSGQRLHLPANPVSGKQSDKLLLKAPHLVETAQIPNAGARVQGLEPSCSPCPALARVT
jgi:hypothetical protein